MEDPDRAVLRRKNIVAVQPILRALRTNSLGSWTAALRKREQLRSYREKLAQLLPILLPHGRARSEEPVADPDQTSRPRIALVVIGTERGLCGRFNLTLVEYCEQYLQDWGAQGATVEIVALGARVIRILRSRGRKLHTAKRLPSASLPSWEIGASLMRQWLERYEQNAVDALDVAYCQYRGAGGYAPIITRVVPPSLPIMPADDSELWPPFEIETDPAGLYSQVIEQWIVTWFYDLLLQSAVAEHAARSQLMDAATQNAQRALDELSQAIQLARQYAITSEMQELAAGAGLLRRQR